MNKLLKLGIREVHTKLEKMVQPVGILGISKILKCTSSNFREFH